MHPTAGVALLRGINVGRAKRVAMADLRTLFEELGFTGVRTVLNSGNVVFGSAPRALDVAGAAIEEALVRRLGVAARVTLLGAADLALVIEGNPLLGQASDPARLIAFILSCPDQHAVLAPLLQQDWAPGALALGTHAAYVWCPGGVLDSAAAGAVAKLLGDATTARNWNTLGKLRALCQQS